MKNGLKVVDTGLSIIDHGTAIIDRQRTNNNVKVERKAADKLGYALQTINKADQYIQANGNMSARSRERCEDLIDAYKYAVWDDIRNTNNRW